jgi:hypothetical protein
MAGAGDGPARARAIENVWFIAMSYRGASAEQEKGSNHAWERAGPSPAPAALCNRVRSTPGINRASSDPQSNLRLFRSDMRRSCTTGSSARSVVISLSPRVVHLDRLDHDAPDGLGLRGQRRQRGELDDAAGRGGGLRGTAGGNVLARFLDGRRDGHVATGGRTLVRRRDGVDLLAAHLHGVVLVNNLEQNGGNA